MVFMEHQRRILREFVKPAKGPGKVGSVAAGPLPEGLVPMRALRAGTGSSNLAGRAADVLNGRQPPPAENREARAQTPLDSPQQAMGIGAPLPLIMARRRTVNGQDRGGVLVFPKATECQFSNNATTVTARYHCVIGEGQIGPVQVRDFRVGSCRRGTFSTNYNQRAGTWSPGSVATPQSGYQVPTFPQVCGGGGAYIGMTTLEFSHPVPGGSDEWRLGCNVFIREGSRLGAPRLVDGVMGPSDNFVDLVLYALRNSGRAPDALIDLPSLTAAAKFLDTNGILCNGEFGDSKNLASWLLEILPKFLLRETQIGGKFGLRPLVPADASGRIIIETAQNPDWVLTTDNIIPGSLKITPVEPASRLPVPMVAIWRQQAQSIDIPINRTLAADFAGGATGAVESHDLSQWCDNELHAAKVLAYMLNRRILSEFNGSVTIRQGNQTGRMVEGDVVQIKYPHNPLIEPTRMWNKFVMIEGITIDDQGSEEITFSHWPVNSAGQGLISLAVAQATAPGFLLPAVSVGACDEAGKSTDTSVPASSTPFPSVSFRSGGSGITPGGGGGGFDRTPQPDRREEARPPENTGAPHPVGGGLPSTGPGGATGGGPDMSPPGATTEPGPGCSMRWRVRGFHGQDLYFKYMRIHQFGGGGPIPSVTTTGRTVRSKPPGESGQGTFQEWIVTFLRSDGTTRRQSIWGRPNIDMEVYEDCTPPDPEAFRRYIVQPGDTLSGIAGKKYGDPSRWPEIYEKNRPAIGPDPDRIFPGTPLEY